MDRRQLDAGDVVADRAQGVAAGLEQVRILGDGLAGGLSLGLLEHLELDLLGVAERLLVVGEVLVEPSWAAQVRDEARGVGDRGERVEDPSRIVEPEALPGIGGHVGEARR